MKTNLILTSFAVLSLSATSMAQQMIFPGNLSMDPSLVSHGQEFSTRRWAMDATGGLFTMLAGGSTPVTFDYAATPTPFGNWSVGGPAQGSGNILTTTFAAGNLTNVVDINGDLVSMVDGTLYRLSYTMKPSEFSYGSGLGTWAIGHGDDMDVQWSYNGNVANSSVTLDAYAWQTVSFDFTYEAGLDSVIILQSFNGGPPNAVRLTGSGGPTPGVNLVAPTLQFAGASPVPEPSTAALGLIAGFLLFRRRR